MDDNNVYLMILQYPIYSVRNNINIMFIHFLLNFLWFFNNHQKIMGSHHHFGVHGQVEGREDVFSKDQVRGIIEAFEEHLGRRRKKGRG